MKLAIVVGVVLIAAIAINVGTSQSNRCLTGNVRGFASVKGDPRFGGAGSIPNRFSSSSLLFGTRYNCTKKGVLVRRIDEGIYDVQFPGNVARVAQVTPLTNGSSASVTRLPDSIFRIIIRGPIVTSNILTPKEAEFNITIV